MAENTITLSLKLDATPAVAVLKSFIATAQTLADQTKQALNIDIKPIDFGSSISAVNNLENATKKYNPATTKNQGETEQAGKAAEKTAGKRFNQHVC